MTTPRVFTLPELPLTDHYDKDIHVALRKDLADPYFELKTRSDYNHVSVYADLTLNDAKQLRTWLDSFIKAAEGKSDG